MSDNKWFSVGNNFTIDEDDDPYCKYCYQHFKAYREMVNGVCQSCGRPSDYIQKEKQSKLQLSSLNDPLNPEDMKALSLDFVYTDMEQKDETKEGKSTSIRMKANSLKEAMNMLWEADTGTQDQFQPLKKVIRGYDFHSVKLDER